MSAPEVDLRPLRTELELEQCVELQRATWGDHFHELVPPAILKISQEVGGVAIGAFDADDALLGFVFGISGVRGGRIAHWSHMLAVWSHARGLGLGRRLKEAQRDRLLAIGCEVVYWTYDPLVARNANLNIGRLGARPVEYVRDMYGADTGSDLHSGLGTDRFIVEWEIASPRVVEALARAHHDLPGPGRDAIVAGGPELGDLARLESRIEPGAELWIAVPADIEEVKASRPDEARAWRATTRAAFERAFELGLAVAGFSVGAAGEDGCCYYRLAPAERATEPEPGRGR